MLLLGSVAWFYNISQRKGIYDEVGFEILSPERPTSKIPKFNLFPMLNLPDSARTNVCYFTDVELLW
jgi:hypothetical protein